MIILMDLTRQVQMSQKGLESYFELEQVVRRDITRG